MDTYRVGHRISRRRMLKRIGAGAVVAWTAPVLTSIITPAYAQASPTCIPLECNGPAIRCGTGPGCLLHPGCRQDQSSCVVLVDNSCFCTDEGFCFAGTAGPVCQTDADCDRHGHP